VVSWPFPSPVTPPNHFALLPALIFYPALSFGCIPIHTHPHRTYPDKQTDVTGRWPVCVTLSSAADNGVDACDSGAILVFMTFDVAFRRNQTRVAPL